MLEAAVSLKSGKSTVSLKKRRDIVKRTGQTVSSCLATTIL